MAELKKDGIRAVMSERTERDTLKRMSQRTTNNTDSKQEALRLAVASLLDIVNELVIALHNGDRPDEAFTDTTVEVIRQHKRELNFND